jgi:anaerobic magnesium-protoporphyrin IX monomethyl ester cyclase
MSERVLLVAPAVALEASYPLGLASLAAALRAAGADCVGLDLRLRPDGLVRYGATPPPVAVVDTSIRSVGTVRRLVADLRRRGVRRVVAVGPAAAVAPALFLEPGGADAAVTGDAEAVVPELLAAAAGPARPVPGAWIRDATGRLQSAPGGVLPAGRLPTPDREVFPLAGYAGHGLRSGRRYAAIEASRGCPFACTFCPVPRRPGGHRVRPAAAVLDEMARLVTEGVTGFFLEDEQPLADRAWLAVILEGLRRRLPGAVLELPNGVRADLLDADLLGEMAAAGVRRLAIGVESGSEGVREALGRPVTTARLLELIAAAKRRGLVVTGYFMIGLPGETRGNLLATLAAPARLPFHYAHLSVYWPWDPPLEGLSPEQQRLATPRLLGYLGAYASVARLRDLWEAGDLSLATLPHAVSRLGSWLAAGSRGGGGW